MSKVFPSGTFGALTQALLDSENKKLREYMEIDKRLTSIEEIVLAHQSWAVMRNEERQCHLAVRNLLDSIRKIMNTEEVMKRLKDGS